MTKQQHKFKDKNTMRDTLTNKRIGNKEVVIVDNAIDYVKKQGYIVSKPKTIIEIRSLMNSFLVLALILLFASGVSALSEKTFSKTPSIDTSNFIRDSFNTDYGLIKINKDSVKSVEYNLISTSEGIIDLVMYGKATSYLETSLFDDTVFLNEYGRNTNLKEGSYYLLTSREENYNEPIYKSTCDKSEIPKCINELIGTEKKTRTVKEWVKYNGESVKPGNYEWKYEGKRNINQIVDIQPVKDGRVFNEWAWFNQSWNRKKTIYINVTYSGNENQTATLINITYDSDMKVDFSDLMFTDASETVELGYWFYNNTVVNSTLARVWLNTSDLNASNKTIYMYYGNPNAISKSNISKVFLMGDDFEGTAISPVWLGDTANAVQGGGVLNLSGGGSFKRLYYSPSTINDYVLETRISTTTASGAVSGMVDLSATTSAARVDSFTIHNSGFLAGLNSGDLTGGVSASNVWYRGYFENYLIGNDNVTWTNDTGLYNGALFNLNNSRTTAASNTHYVLLEDLTSTARYDWIYARRHLNQTPIVTFGAETSNSGFLTIINSEPINNSNISARSVNLICNASTVLNNITSVTLNLSSIFANRTINITGLNENNYSAVFNVSLQNGTYYWNCLGYGNRANGTSELIMFNFNNTMPYTTRQDIFIFDFSKQTNVLIFIVMLLVATATLIYVSWFTGCIFFIINGMILLVSLDNKLIGMMVLIFAVLLSFKGDNKQ